MKSASKFFLSLWMAGLVCLSAQETPRPPDATTQTAPADAAAPDTLPPPAPNVPTAPTAPDASTRTNPPPLRDLTQSPGADTPVEAAPAPDVTAQPESQGSAGRVEGDDGQMKTPARGVRRNRGEHAVVAMGDAHLGKGDVADAVIAIFGDATAEGEVYEGVVAVFGDAYAAENVGAAVVAIAGEARADKQVREGVVSVFGSTLVNGEINGDVVAVFGPVKLGPGARVRGNVVSIGFGIERGAGSEIHGQVTELAFLRGVPVLSTLGLWFREAFAKGRLLTFHGELLWPWLLALAFLAFYLLLAVTAGGAVTRCATTLEQRPGRTLLAALIAMVAAPPLLVLLSFTVVGVFVQLLAMLVGFLVGKAAFLAFLGRRVTKPLNIESVALAVLLGGLMVMLLYTVPLIGMMVWMFSSVLGLGMVIYTLMLSSKRERPVGPAVAGIAPAPGYSGVAPAAPTASHYAAASVAAVDVASPAAESRPGSTSAVESSSSTGISAPMQSPGFGTAASVPPPLGAVPPVPPTGMVPPPVPAAVNYSLLPRAGFWIRLAASLIDVILVATISGMLNLGDVFLVLLAAYAITMWTLKGTTVGGIICGLKVVRLDDRKLDWTVALVRGLAGFLSFAVAGLGFIWVAFDDQAQSWHDKIAGTTIVMVPKGMSLV